METPKDGNTFDSACPRTWKRGLDPVEVRDLIQKRKVARLEQQFDVADAIQAQLDEHGVQMKSKHIDATEWCYVVAAGNKKAGLDDTPTPARSEPKHRETMNKRRQARKVGKKVRFEQFADFCVETFGNNLLKGGVIDVAGGKCRMALELCLERQIPCTVVDPRFSRLGDWTARRIAKLALEASSVSVVNPKDDIDPKKTPRASASYQLSPSEFFSNSDQEDPDRKQKIDSFMELMGFQFHKCLFNEEYCKDNPIWENSSVVIGMHPDEATEAIVDEALKIGKSFAVVPCCVFPSLFKERRLSNGRTVRSLEQFIQYLSEKHTGIKVKALENMPGCNTVVYKV